jgi:hypothetical protein
MYTRPRQQRPILISIFECSLSRLEIDCLLLHQRLLMLLFLDGYQSTFQVLHDLQKVLEAELVSFNFHPRDQIDSFCRFSAYLGQDSLNSLECHKACLVLVKYVENRTEVFNLALRINREDIHIATQLYKYCQSTLNSPYNRSDVVLLYPHPHPILKSEAHSTDHPTYRPR